MSYDFLKPFVKDKEEIYSKDNNLFFPVTEKEIQEAEETLKMPFPSQLKEFYREIGYGFLTSPYNPPPDYRFCNINRISSPGTIRDILVEGPGSWFISEATYELLEPGDLPFFEIADGSCFLLMKLNSENPNAVWDWDTKIEDSFERFIWRLYYEDPGYYGEIITAD
jgi:hypothetical protein